MVNNDGIADGNRSRHITSQRDASTEANNSRLAGSALRIPAIVANVNAGRHTNAVTKCTGGSPYPSHSTIDEM